MPVINTITQTEPSFWSHMIVWLFDQQRQLQQQLTQHLRTLSADGRTKAAIGLITASFLYGLLHAAGPGHGKAILSAYLMTQKEKVAHGVKLAAGSAFCQGLVAIVLVYGLIYIAGFLPRETSEAIRWSERASFLLIGAIGCMLLWRAFCGIRARLFLLSSAHAHNCECGHAHAPDAHQIAHSRTFKSSLWVVLSIGLRPCTGAVLVLVFAKVTGIVWAGVLAVAAMSLGTAIAVAGLAFAAVNLRSWAKRVAQGRSSTWLYIGYSISLAAGLLLLAMSASLLIASFAPGHPLGL